MNGSKVEEFERRFTDFHDVKYCLGVTNGTHAIESIKIYSGMEELLKQLTTDGYKCALCTGEDRTRTLEILNGLMLREYFETVVCSDDVDKPKPYPDSLVLAMNNMGIKPDNAVMVGDARNDILCAISAGVKIIAVTWGDVSKEVLEREYPNITVNTVDELSIAIKRLIGNIKVC